MCVYIEDNDDNDVKTLQGTIYENSLQHKIVTMLKYL